ncbi:prolipoprotein diacylglyceryl transferase [uncultured Anaerococcus sp.]|uniref:prolipoprotein diacylglyceryl transferase n=1 Tax=uncultured Anaerococcus sp. TaxID=293428 RepID=UPI0025D6D5CA|nr:prolipoprotein diacylglyceryl transferase [uncultured Anaerococcus sp.]
MEFNIDRVAFSIFGLDIYWYAIIIIGGILIASQFAKKEFVRRGFDEDFIYDVLFVVLPIGIIGARLWYVAFEWDYYGANPSQILNFRAGGLAIHGGIFAGLIALWIYAKYKNIPLLDLTDVMVPSLILGQAIGRWGNFANAEAHGGPTDLPWGIIIDGVKVHPTFLYESIGDFLIFLFLIFYRKKNPSKGKQTAIYFIGYGVLRFFVEGLRTDSLYVLGLRTAQLVSIGFVIVGIILFVYANKNNLPPYFQKAKSKEKAERIIKFK